MKKKKLIQSYIPKIKEGVINDIKKYLHTEITAKNFKPFNNFINALLSTKDKRVEDKRDLFGLNNFLGQGNEIDLNKEPFTEEDRQLFAQKQIECKLFEKSFEYKTNIDSISFDGLLFNDTVEYLSGLKLDKILPSPRYSSIFLNKISRFIKNDDKKKRVL